MLEFKNESATGCNEPRPYIDTLLTVNGLNGAEGQSYTLGFVVPAKRTTGEWIDSVRAAGPIIVRARARGDTTRAVGGVWVQGYRNDDGCSLIAVPNDGPTLVTNPPALEWDGYVVGHYVPSPAPQCGRTVAFHIDRFTPTPAFAVP
jgi:hypothetical protein